MVTPSERRWAGWLAEIRPSEPGPRLSLGIDRIRCDGRGYCAELLPEVIRLDDWGYPIVAPGGVPEHLAEHARRAVSACPLLALRLVRARRRS